MTKLQQADRMLAEGKRVSEIVLKLGISQQTYYRWRKQFDGLATDEVVELHRLQNENGQLRRRLADAQRENAALQELVRGKF
ncbi:MAG: transposase [Propionibacteriaceae bacterium]|nr:transposase [Propionibacteriaceae bacterium]